MQALDIRSARRLALARAGLLNARWTGLPARTTRGGAEKACLAVIDRFGYLQLDTVSVAGARSHTLVLLARLERLDPRLPETLLRPAAPLFEYWGHEASWLPLELYPAFEFRRREFRSHPWWGDLVGDHPEVARGILHRIRDQGPLRSVDLDGQGGRGWWELKLSKKVATALWSSGKLAIRERSGFQRVFDLPERVIPAALLDRPWDEQRSLRALVLKALDGHGWAAERSIAATWRLRASSAGLRQALRDLRDEGLVLPCELRIDGARARPGWIRPADLELADRLKRVRPRRDRGVLLSPFDPLLWDRARVKRLFSFDYVLEIFKPRSRRRFGYYSMPVLAGEHLVARVDLKARKKQGILELVSVHREEGRSDSDSLCAIENAIRRFADSLSLRPTGRIPS